MVRIILVICSVALLLMSALYILVEYFSFKEAEKSKVSTLAVVIASNSSAALAFQSSEDATEILGALRADKYIKAACLYDVDGKVFATYPKNLNHQALPVKPREDSYFFKGKFIEGFQSVKQGNLHLGTLYIKSDLGGLYSRISFNILVAFILILVTLGVGYLLSNVVQRTISQPIIALEQTAKSISEKGDYSIRAIKTGNDELGSLTDAFNTMLNRIEHQNYEIIQVNRESSKLAAIVESSGDAIIGTSSELLITSWNSSAERMLGFTSEEMMGLPVSIILPREQLNLEAITDKLKSGEQLEPIETYFVTKNKELVDISLTISPVKDQVGKVIGMSQIARDITHQKKTERKIVENEEHLRLATQSAELGTFDLDLIAGTMLWDKRCRELFGINHQEPVIYEKDFVKRLHEEDRERIIKETEATFDKGLTSGIYDVEYRTVAETDKRVRWVKAKGRVFFDPHDKPIRFIGSVLDITRQKQDELRKNDFIAIISHELKTPLTTIKSYIQLLLARAQKETDAFGMNALTRADSQTSKMASMIKDFLNLARIEEGKLVLVKEIFDVGILMDNVVSEANFLSNTHDIKVDYCKGFKVNADKEKISQVLINLISNSVKYSQPGTSITVGCAQEGNRLKIFVSDEGVGISPGDQIKLFTRFYRVENDKIKTVSGFGIGLYIVSEILKYHDTKIEVDSQEGVGSTFYFYLEALV
ncbi:PAS domain S-box protein [Pedobacter sp. P351]|uniref:PAS domain S-box protein n=1 Tax=Pedobacter superstes TaxID=3133441 RepID=UPI0030A744FF